MHAVCLHYPQHIFSIKCIHQYVFSTHQKFVLTNAVHLIYILCVYIKEYLVKILKNKLSYLRAKAYGTVRQRNDWESPRKKKLPFLFQNSQCYTYMMVVTRIQGHMKGI